MSQALNSGTHFDKLDRELAKDIIARSCERVAPPPKLKISQWASRYRRLARESSAEPGLWRNEKTPYLVDVMDSVNHPRTQEIIIQASSQVGKSEVLLNVLGYFIHQDPAPILCVFPNLDLCETFSKDRIAPMIRDTEVLADLVDEPKSKDSSNTIKHKDFPGGNLDIVTAVSPTGLASKVKRITLLDEIDRFPASAGGEGDPIKLASRRQDTYAHNRKLIACSTPTSLQTSKIYKLYCVEK